MQMTLKRFNLCEKEGYMHKPWVYVTERDEMTKRRKKGAPIFDDAGHRYAENATLNMKEIDAPLLGVFFYKMPFPHLSRTSSASSAR